jgi:hypothetical protein
MKKNTLSILLILCSFASFSQSTPQKVALDFAGLSQKLRISKTENVLGIGNVGKSEVIVNLPMLDGQNADFRMVEYFIVPEGSKTDIKTYYGERVGDPMVTCRVTLSKDKLMASILDNGRTIIVEKATGSLLSDDYQVYEQKKSPQQCDNVIEEQIKNGRVGETRGILNYSYGSTLKTYRLALIVTNEFYADFINDAGVNAEIVAIVNNLNALYEKELAVRMTLVSPNNPVSSNFFYRRTNTTSTYFQSLPTIHTEVDTRFGSANYDLGHCLHNSGGGVAGLGVVCSSSFKGRGWSGSTTASSILLFAHELGHQFDAPHTFNGASSGNCSIGNRSATTAFEPGSGSTIMSYFGTCFLPKFDLSGSPTGYFHTNSLERMSLYVVNTATNKGGTCGTIGATGNTAPIANAGSDFTIPRNTPFKLKGTATDANNDPLTYTWEQLDNAAVSDTSRIGHTANSTGISAVNSTTAPLFRSKQSSSGERTFPNMSFVLNNVNNPADEEGEDLPNVSRALNFRLTARDSKNGGGGVHCDAVVVTVDANKGPLSVTSPNTAVSLAAGASHTITWAVNSTNLLSPNVKILLSTDGGGSFPFTLSASTPNDGSQSVTIPSNVPASSTARIIVASNNSTTAEFFDASDVNFNITSTCLVKGSFICSETPVSAQEGNLTLNLGMNSSTGNLLLNGIGTYTSVSTVGRLIFMHQNDQSTGCVQLSNFNQNTKLVQIRVRDTGVFNVSATNTGGGSLPFSIYNSNTLSCSSFQGSNAFVTGSSSFSFFSNRSFNLDGCQTYFVVVMTSGNFILNFSGSIDVFEVQNMPSGFSYTYTAVNQSTNLIADVSPSSNFTGTAAGTYRVYGLMYANGFNTNTLIGNSIEQAYGLGNCLLFSNNSKPVTIIANPCSTTLTLVNPADNISSGNVTKTAASGVGGKITATNLVTGTGTRATYNARSIELNQGFLADQGTVFRAEVGGCN